jgi:hypothetical protein
LTPSEQAKLEEAMVLVGAVRYSHMQTRILIQQIKGSDNNITGSELARYNVEEAGDLVKLRELLISMSGGV